MKIPSAPASKSVSAQVVEPVRKVRPLANVTIEPVGARSPSAREHSVKIVLELTPGKPEASLPVTMAIARKALDGFAPAAGETDRRSFTELSASHRGKGGVLNVAVVAIEGRVSWPDRPSVEIVDLVGAVLSGDGYRVVVRERRECGQPGCSSDAMTDWRQAEGIPSAWFSPSICGKHSFKQCARCKSIFQLSSFNAAGQSPSVHCEVCGHVLIEWGSSKRWDAELVTRGVWAAEAAPEPAK